MAPSTKNNLSAIIIALAVAVVAGILTCTYFQNTTARIVIEGYFYQDTLVTVHSVSGDGQLTPFDKISISGLRERRIQKYSTKRVNKAASNIQVSFAAVGAAVGKVQPSQQSVLLSIQLIKPYQVHFYFNGDNVARNFSATHGSLHANGLLELDPSTRQASILSNSAIARNNWPLIAGIPLLFFFGIFFLVRNSDWPAIPAFADMSLGNRISSSGEFDTINGIRGLAALLVLVSHTAPGFEALGMGLALLFVISGFLLSKPFVMDNAKVFNWSNLERYFTKRLKRILPMYYLYIFVVYVVTFKFDTALRHFFFVQAEGHLWPMTQIFAFYMLLPFVLIITSASHRINRSLPIIILSIAIYFCISLMRGWKPFYNGLFTNEFFLYAFLFGVLGSYLQYALIGQRGLQVWGKRYARELLGITALIVTFLVIAWSAPMKPSMLIFQWVSQFWVKCIASVAIILLALNTPSTFYRHIIANPLFRSVGVIGFSFYLLHGLGMQIFEQIQIQVLGNTEPDNRSWEFTAGAFFVTYIMAVITYSYVERPFFGYREKNKQA